MKERASAWLDASLLHRLWFSEADEHGSGSLPFALCRRGDLVVTRNVTCGTIQGRELRAFDLEVLVRDEEPGISPGSHRLVAGLVAETFPDGSIVGSCRNGGSACSCAPARSARRLAVSPEGLLSMLADLAIVPDQDVELDAFNRSFEVRADDRKFANEFLDARMVSFLVERAIACVVETVGNRILVAHPAGDLPDVEAVLALAFGVADRVPNAVTTLYPALPSGELTPRCPLGPDGLARAVDEPVAAHRRRAFDPWPDVPRGWG